MARELGWLVVLALAALLAFSLWSYSPRDSAWSTTGLNAAPANWLGTAGAWVADILLSLFGRSAWWCVLAIVCFGAMLLRRDTSPIVPLTHRLPWVPVVVAGLALLLMCGPALESLRLYKNAGSLPAGAGGMVGQTLSPWMMAHLGFLPGSLLALAVCVLGLTLLVGVRWLAVFEALGRLLLGPVQARARILEPAAQVGEPVRSAEPSFVDHTPWSDLDLEQAREAREHAVEAQRTFFDDHEPLQIESPAQVVAPSKKIRERVAREKQTSLFDELPPASALPPLSLLAGASVNQPQVGADTLEHYSRLIERKLSEFNVPVKIVAAQPGPVITRYEVEPDVGVKGSQIVNLARDIARSLGVASIRVVETIPGKTTMGLEMPNPKRQMVSLVEILSAATYGDSSSHLTLAMGKDISGKPVTADLAKMPHLLVAGTTGSGKSVAVNAMILSLLYKADPNQVRLVLIDPKMLELSVYDGIAHLLCPVVTDMRLASNALNWCVGEMERRYKLMSALGVRGLGGYNTKVTDAKAREAPLTNPFSLTPDAPEPLETLPTIVVVIDELADLMMVAGKKIEELIARLAQKARAAGIHLILATQRPSVDVITGLIKANIPSRVAFQVSSKIDSRTILDQMGAESLLGQGDMLYLPPGTGYPMRVHGAFVGDDEVHRVVEHLKAQGEPRYVEGVLTQAGGDEEGGDAGDSPEEADPLYDKAVNVVLTSRRATISYVQRQLQIGYNRSARLIEQMERAGIVSAMGPSGNREVLVPNREA